MNDLVGIDDGENIRVILEESGFGSFWRAIPLTFSCERGALPRTHNRGVNYVQRDQTSDARREASPRSR